MAESRAELIFAFVYTIGTDADPVIKLLGDYLKHFGYSSHEFRVSDHLRTLDLGITFNPLSAYQEMGALMDAGNRARELSAQNDILAVMAVNEIADQRRNDQPLDRMAQIIRSLKTPEEVCLLRNVYRPGFFLIGIASNDDERERYLTKVKGLSIDEANELIARDQDEKLIYGQRTRNTFYLSDIFVELTSKRYEEQLERFLELVFGHPFKTPSREEHAMFMAYASAARSSQLGRQVGAAVATPEGEVIAVGFNEVHAAGGGAYWDSDAHDARDHVFRDGVDSNYWHRLRIVESIVASLKSELLTETNVRAIIEALYPGLIAAEVDRKLLEVQNQLTTNLKTKERVHSSELKDITEYGRAVHAEMDALLTCLRLGISTKGKRLFTTTFPCHNCTRHIIGSGISEVTYIEPYPKSRAADLHSDSICFDREEAEKNGRIPFLPFVGIGPRRYLDLFSADLTTGAHIERKDAHGRAFIGERAIRAPRVPMLPLSYIERETKLLDEHKDVLEKLEGNHDDENSRQNPLEK